MSPTPPIHKLPAWDVTVVEVYNNINFIWGGGQLTRSIKHIKKMVGLNQKECFFFCLSRVYNSRLSTPLPTIRAIIFASIVLGICFGYYY